MVAYTASPIIDPDALSYIIDTDVVTNWATFTGGSDELVIDYTNKKIALVVVGGLGSDGVTIKCVYSKLKEVWKDDSTLIKFPFPMGPITDEQFELINGWNWELTQTSGGASQTTPEILRTGGWSVVDTSGNIVDQYAGVITLGTFVDNTDQGYIQQGATGQYATSANIKLTNPVNQAVQILNYVNPATAGSWAAGTASVVVDNAGGEFVAGDTVFLSGATPVGYNGTYTLTSANTTAIEYAIADPSGSTSVQPRVYNDYRSYFKVFVREQGKTFATSRISDIGVSQLTYQAYRFPLTNSTDLKISNSDGLINGATVSTTAGSGSVVTLTTTLAHGFKVGDEVIVAAVVPAGYNGTYTISTVPTDTTFTYAHTETGSYTSGGTVKGADTDNIYSKINITYLRDANDALYNILGTVTNTTYAVGDVVQEDNGATSRWFECTTAGTVTGATGGAVAQGTWGGTAVFTAYTGERQIGANYYAFSLLIDADTDVTGATSGDALRAQVYEKVQWFLRESTDIDVSGGIGVDPTVIGKTADLLLQFVGDTLITSTGVYIDSFNTNDQNDIEFFDYAGVQRLYPFVSTLTLSFNDNLKNDTAAKYWVFFTTTTGGSNYGTATALIVDQTTGTMTGTVSGSTSVTLDFDYDNNVQGSRTAGTSAAITAVAIGLTTGQFVTSVGTIARSKTNSISLVAPLERNYANPV
jgi:hypothetical protein